MSNSRKSLSPLNIALFAFVLFLSFSASLTPVSAGAANQKSVLNAVNSIRIQFSLPPLQLHPSLQQAAQDQAKLMAQTGKMAHKVKRGEGFKARLKRVGYRGLAAENIARGQRSLGKVLTGWLNSPGHRRNMLHPRMRYFGLAAAKSGGRNYWAMVLGG